MLVIFIDEKDNAFGVQTETGFTGFQCECWFSQSKLPTEGKFKDQLPISDYWMLLNIRMKLILFQWIGNNLQ